MNEEIFANKYRIECLLGSGGTANVYRAKNIYTNKIVAIKVLKDEYRDNPEFLRRFKKEANAVATLSHENIVKLYEVGEYEDKSYIVLEHIEGSTLKEIIEKEGKLDIKRAVSIVSQLLDAIGHAHGKGIIHRDIKPQNILITKKGKVKLTDFGIATEIADSTKTYMKDVMGTVYYISPERIKGESASFESDIYSIGIVLYEMLLGTVPFKGDLNISIAYQHMMAEMKQPIEIDPDIPKALNDIILKATAKEPATRYSSASKMKSDISRAIREPDGKFVLDTLIKDVNKQRNKNSKLLKTIAISTISLVIVFSLIFVIGHEIMSIMDSGSESGYVPKLVGKTIEEAKEYASIRGFEIEIQSYSASSEYDDGQIISQNPDAGSKSGDRTVIKVVVCDNSETVSTLVPNIIGMNLLDAQNELYGHGLRIGDIEYEYNSTVEEGEIFEQKPYEDTSVLKGDSVDIWINGDGTNGSVMPSVTGLLLDEACELLYEVGIDKIIVSYQAPKDELESMKAEDSVLSQQPFAYEYLVGDKTAKLIAKKSEEAKYSADVVLDVDIEDNDTSIMVTMISNKGYEIILYEGVMQKGDKQTISYTTFSWEEGERDCVVYINDEVIKQSKFNFTYRSNDSR